MRQRARSRYGIRSKTVDNIKFASSREADRYVELKLLQSAKEIRDLTVHPRFKIVIGGVPILFKSKGYPNGRQMVYVADFSYVDLKQAVLCPKCEKPLGGLGVVIEDVKMQSGHRTEVYKIKRALMDAMGRPIIEV